ncbi:phycobiliprotein lyase [Pannus brasiliensis CCIBt3594]|uniref:Chromophore lyase CpcS/CpeS n=1 Tax=Pannus brasiliensis CCIBt3594 TaxID=1427578 RepID=A0AAW9QZQ8_9CHRO
MEIKEFINLCAGQWFSQRTSYRLASRNIENHKSEITIDLLTPDRPEAIDLRGDGENCLGGWKATWNNSVDWGQPKQTGSTLVVFLADAEDASSGSIVKSGGPGKPSLVGRYRLRSDEALTLTIEDEGRVFEERLWFASPNLRLRTSIIQNPDKTRNTVFYSEIRKMSA